MKETKIKVLALLPLELPKVVELDNTLEAMRKFVGGNIECLPLYDLNSEFTLVCNDEGKLLELPDDGWRYIDEETDWNYDPFDGAEKKQKPCTTVAEFMRFCMNNPF